jgi:hypothetical protein
MGPNRRAQEREQAAARAAAEVKRAEAERRAIVDAQKIVAIWNARHAGGRALWFYPTIGAAIASWTWMKVGPVRGHKRTGIQRGDCVADARAHASIGT